MRAKIVAVGAGVVALAALGLGAWAVAGGPSGPNFATSSRQGRDAAEASAEPSRPTDADEAGRVCADPSDRCLEDPLRRPEPCPPLRCSWDPALDGCLVRRACLRSPCLAPLRPGVGHRVLCPYGSGLRCPPVPPVRPTACAFPLAPRAVAPSALCAPGTIKCEDHDVLKARE